MHKHCDHKDFVVNFKEICIKNTDYQMFLKISKKCKKCLKDFEIKEYRENDFNIIQNVN